jgi:hypothetical protein
MTECVEDGDVLVDLGSVSLEGSRVVVAVAGLIARVPDGEGGMSQKFHKPYYISRFQWP